MKHLSKFILVFGLLVYSISSEAQSTIASSGGNAGGTGGSASYTVGQIVYTTDNGTTGSVAKGVQQPYEISVITAIEKAKDISLSCSVYPNPVSDLLTLKIDNYVLTSLTYKLIDVNGKLIENKKISGNELTITMSNLSPALYLLKIFDHQKEIKTFKIIKK
jgi:hypothetical protein